MVGILVAGSLLNAPQAHAYQRPGHTERVSTATDGTEPQVDASFVPPDLSADGRYVAFSTSAPLVPEDTNGVADVYVRDRMTGDLERVSVASDGTEGTGSSSTATISADGRMVAFHSSATNLVPNDTNGVLDVFVHDRATGETRNLTITGNALSTFPAISGDGKRVAFQSDASNLVPGDTNGTRDTFVADLTDNSIVRASVASDGTQANGPSRDTPAISFDGSVVAFSSDASSLIPNDTNPGRDTFVRDITAGTTELVSVNSHGVQTRQAVFSSPSISEDGNVVLFETWAWNLVPLDTNGDAGPLFLNFHLGFDIFARDRAAATTTRVSVTSAGGEFNRDSTRASISGDGRYVAFTSVPPFETPGFAKVYVHDLARGVTEEVSVASDGTPGDAASFLPAVSNGGQTVAFLSRATNLTPGITNDRIDVFVRDRGPALGAGDITVALENHAIEVYGAAWFSGAEVASVSDPAGDAVGGEIGADLIGAEIVLRPEQEDLLFRLPVTSLPAFRDPRTQLGAGGMPGIVYGWDLTAEGTDFRLRGMQIAPAPSPRVRDWDQGDVRTPMADEVWRFDLLRCAPVCTPVQTLEGGGGTVGDEVRIAVPLDAFPIPATAALTGLRAFTAAASDPLVLDEVVLGDASLHAPAVNLGIAPAGAPQDQVVFDTPADLVEGRFSGSLDVSSLSPGHYDVWARACLGELCGGAASTPVTIEGDPLSEIKDTVLTLTVVGQGNNMTLRAHLVESDAPSVGVAGKRIDFYSDGELIGSDMTDGDGVATIAVPPGHRGANRTYEAVFDGDDFYGPSSDSRPGRGGGEAGSSSSTDQTGPSNRRAVPFL